MQSSPRPPLLERAQSSPLGIALILGITLTAAVSIVVVGGNVIQGSQQSSQIGQAEHAVTQLDSKAAQVALGDSDSQTVSLGNNGGTYRVDEDAGQIRIVHKDWNGTHLDGEEDYDSAEIYSGTLGTVVYDNGGTEIAYQGGGVWRKDDAGGSTMVSQPEFHYRGSTLTLPLVHVRGSGAASGNTRAHVTRLGPVENIYPHDTEKYPNDDTFSNPVTDGNMSVEVTSEYCEGWERYLRDRTDGEVTTCEDGTVTADLVALGTQGEFDPTGGGNLDIVAFEQFLSFHVTLRSTSSSRMNNIQWSMHAEDGDDQIEILMNPGNQNDCEDTADVVVYYSDDGGDNYHTWVNDADFEFECPGDDIEVTIDFSDDVDMTYEEYERSNRLHYGGGDFYDDETIDETDYTDGETAPLGTVLEHYFQEMDGNIDFSIEERQGQGNPASLSDSSSGDIRYDGGGDSVTYLHVTENRIQVELNG